MVDRTPEFESADKKGTTDVYSGTVGLAWTAIPTVAGTEIQSFSVHNVADQVITNTISVSLDGGTTVMDILYPSGFTYQLIKGSKTQIHLLGSAASVSYRVVLNREQT